MSKSFNCGIKAFASPIINDNGETVFNVYGAFNNIKIINGGVVVNRPVSLDTLNYELFDEIGTSYTLSFSKNEDNDYVCYVNSISSSKLFVDTIYICWSDTQNCLVFICNCYDTCYFFPSKIKFITAYSKEKLTELCPKLMEKYSDLIFS